jgi:hypothetical protein
MEISATDLAESVLRSCNDVRYVAVRRHGQLCLRERAQLRNASSPESDRYEELIVNPTLLTLVGQRGDIDCGGAQFVLIRYGNFFQFVAPVADGHVSVGMEPNCNALNVAAEVMQMLHRHYGERPSSPMVEA